jgi:hypothetical protein
MKRADTYETISGSRNGKEPAIGTVARLYGGRIRRCDRKEP